MALWSGRFEEGVGKFTQEFGASLPIDKHMYAQDIQGSIAHAKMLAKQDIISQFDADRIEVGLMEIRHQIDKGLFTWDINDEDIHMAVEKTLIEDIGQSGARLHTGRSRNDQVATDIRLHAKYMIKELMEQNCRMRESFYNKAEKHYGVIMPGFTHLQHAQPVLLN